VKKNYLFLMIFCVVSSSLSSVRCVDRSGVAVKIPGPAPAHKRSWGLVTRGYKDDMELLHNILDALKITDREALRLLSKKCKNDNFAISVEVRELFSGLGFFDDAGNVHEAWKRAILEYYRAIKKDIAVAMVPRALADPVDPRSCGFLASMKWPYNPEFLEQLSSVHEILKALKITRPHALRELFLKCRSDLYQLSGGDHEGGVRVLLSRLGFLDDRELVKDGWHNVILSMFCENEQRDLADLVLRASVEDLAMRYAGGHDEVIDLGLIGRNAVTPAMMRQLHDFYPDLLSLEDRMTDEEGVIINTVYGAHMDRIGAALGAPFTTIPVINFEVVKRNNRIRD
jgi:hypothetical protein